MNVAARISSRLAAPIAFPLVAVALLVLGSHAYADSPLTSTDFSIAYASSQHVQRAAEYGLDARVADALSDPTMSHGERAAIVNALGWSIAGQNNASVYLDHVAKAHGKRRDGLTLDDLTAPEALSLGYLVAMDDYSLLQPIGGEAPLERAKPLQLLDAAQAKAPGSYTIAMVRALVVAQVALESDWCRVYRSVDDVVSRFRGTKDLEVEAEKVITEYISLYANECPNPRPVKGP